MKKQIVLPIGFGFSLRSRITGLEVDAPRAFSWAPWKTWENAPVGIEYEVADVPLPKRFEYTVGPDCRTIRWDSSLWEPTLDEESWARSGWPVTET